MDTNTKDELRRLLSGVRAGEEPQGIGIAGYRVFCRRDSFEVLECLKETLAFILTVHRGVESACAVEGEDTDTYDTRLLLEEPVMKQLSDWYRHKFNLSATDTDADFVSGFGWGRDWRWWDWRIRTDNDLLLFLEVSGWPCSGLTVLRRLLEKCGADSMDEISKEDWDGLRSNGLFPTWAGK